jgi:capsular polysaccharide transport system permease protein
MYGTRGLSTQLRVIFALILREARVRHGRARIGYTWAIIEPVLLISVMTFLFTQVGSRGSGSGDFALFFATGVLSFQLYRNTSVYVSMSFDQNKPLFNYPLVKPMDAAIARLCLDSATQFLVILLVLCFQILVLGAPPPNDPPKMALALVLMIFLAFGVGVSLAVLRRFMPAISNVYLVIMGPAFFVSCVFFSVSSVPTMYREWLVWNPLVHGVEGFRSGYYPEYADADVDLFYLFTWVVVLNFIGWVGEWLTRFRNI